MKKCCLIILSVILQWAQMAVAAPLCTSQPIECTIMPIDRNTISPELIPLAFENAVLSENWSGYVAADNLAHPTTGSVTAVYGCWVVPILHPSTVTSYSACWVGIDGFSNSTVQQIGTAQIWDGSSQQNNAWFEMYPGQAYYLLGFPVNPLDLISGSVEYTGDGIFVMTIENITHGVYFTVPTSYTQSTSALRNCAEWVMEAPYYNGVLPLANFENAAFSSCTATINGVTAPISNIYWQCESINMVTTSGTLKAVASSLNGSDLDFTVTWEHE